MISEIYCCDAKWLSLVGWKLKVVKRPVRPVFHCRQQLGGLYNRKSLFGLNQENYNHPTGQKSGFAFLLHEGLLKKAKQNLAFLLAA